MVRQFVPSITLAAILVAATLASGAWAGTCNPNGTCTACKSCAACKHCSKEGGSCSVCKPQGEKPAKPKK